MDQDKVLREHLVAQLRGGQAFDTFGAIVGEFSGADRFVVPVGAERSAWQIVDHLLFALRDILDFSTNAAYVEPKWPDAYWSDSPEGDWDGTLAAYQKALTEMESLVMDPERDLFQTFSWGTGQTLLREAMLAADHASHHLGQLVELRRWISAGT